MVGWHHDFVQTLGDGEGQGTFLYFPNSIINMYF